MSHPPELRGPGRTGRDLGGAKPARRTGTPAQSDTRQDTSRIEQPPVRRQNTAKVNKAQKAPREAPADLQLFTSSWTRFKYQLWLLGMGKDTPPKLSASEQAARDMREQTSATEASLVAEFQQLGAEMNDLVKRQKVHLSAAVLNQNGGGSKTWTAIHLACEYAETLRLPVAVIEGRRDSAVGIDLLGVDSRVTLSSRELYARREEVTTGDALYRLLSSNRYGVLGVKTDETTPANDAFTGKEAGQVIELIKAHVPIVIIDTGNLVTDAIHVGMCSHVTVGIFATLPGAPSLKLCKQTVATSKLHGLGHLITHGFYMVNKLPEGGDPEDFRTRLSAPEHAPILGTHFASALDYESIDRPDTVVDLDKFPLATRVEIRRAAVQALRLQQETGSSPRMTHAAEGIPPMQSTTSGDKSPSYEEGT